MNIKIDAKSILAFVGVFGSGVTVGALGGIKLYKERKGFREWIDNKIYPGLKDFIKERGITFYRILIVTVFENNPKARALFMLVGDTIESGQKKASKQIEKEFYKYKDKLPELIEIVEKKASESN